MRACSASLTARTPVDLVELAELEVPPPRVGGAQDPRDGALNPELEEEEALEDLSEPFDLRPALGLISSFGPGEADF